MINVKKATIPREIIHKVWHTYTCTYIIPRSDLEPGVVVPTPNPAPVVVSNLEPGVVVSNLEPGVVVSNLEPGVVVSNLEPGVDVSGSSQPSVVEAIGKDNYNWNNTNHIFTFEL